MDGKSRASRRVGSKKNGDFEFQFFELKLKITKNVLNSENPLGPQVLSSKNIEAGWLDFEDTNDTPSRQKKCNQMGFLLNYQGHHKEYSLIQKKRMHMNTVFS